MDRSDLFGDVALGEVIGGYRLERLLGAGSTSQVFLGTHVLLGRMSAIKVLAASLISNKEVVSRLLTEARVVNDIRHPNIIDIIDFVETESPPRVALVMEYIEGVSLKAIRETPMTYEQALGVAVQLVEAVQAAHVAGVIHRDLKPDNLLLTPDPRTDPTKVPVLKIVDFGIAKLSGTSGKTATGMMLGTPAYMAPEQVAGRPPPSAATDVFAIGEVLYELLSGKRAYPASAIHETVRAKLRGEIPPLELPPVPGAQILLPLIHRCLALRPADRPPLTEVRDALFGLVAQPSLASARSRRGSPGVLNVPEAETVLAPRTSSRGSGQVETAKDRVESRGLAGSRGIPLPKIVDPTTAQAPARPAQPQPQGPVLAAARSGQSQPQGPAPPVPAMTELSESPIKPLSSPASLRGFGPVTDEITSPADLLADYARGMKTEANEVAGAPPVTITRPIANALARASSGASEHAPPAAESGTSAALTEQFSRPDFAPAVAAAVTTMMIPPGESSPTNRVMPAVTIAALSPPPHARPEAHSSEFPVTPTSTDTNLLDSPEILNVPAGEELRAAVEALGQTPPETAAQGLLQPAGMSSIDETLRPSRSALPAPVQDTQANSIVTRAKPPVSPTMILALGVLAVLVVVLCLVVLILR